MSFINIKLFSNRAIIPKRATPGSAGYDLFSSVDIVVPKRGRILVQTDVGVQIPETCYGRIAPRSGLAVKNGIDVGAGVIDSDYCGTIGVLLFNHSDEDFQIKHGDRIAQLIIEQIISPQFIEVESLEKTLRNDGGYGSTGI
jgi:dUTP pyrophosphatase